jgi:hypothetical protein
MSNHRPTKHSLEQLTTTQLIYKLWKDTTYASDYRNEMARRHSNGDPELTAIAEGYSLKPESPFPKDNGPQRSTQRARPSGLQLRVPDIRPEWHEVLNGEAPIAKFGRAVLESDYDFVDDHIRDKTPDQLRKTLQEFVEWKDHEFFHDLDKPKFQNLLRMIFDAYGRWYVRQRGGHWDEGR